MTSNLDQVLVHIGKKYAGEISSGARHYLEVDIGKEGAALGCSDVEEKYNDVHAVIPLKAPAKGMKVRIDGRTYVNYALLESGVAVPGYVAKEAGLPYKTFNPNHSMIRNFA
jgi:hypothetical protein